MSSRIDLGSHIPLPFPFVIYIEPTNICNFRCSICPESFPDYRTSAGYFTSLSPNLWDRLLPQLRSIRPRVIRFFHTGEPLLNPHLPSMIAQCARNGVGSRLEVTTNGSRLKGDTAQQLLESGLTYLRLSVYSTSDNGYREATGSRFLATEIRDNLLAFRSMRDAAGIRLHIHAELVSNNLRDTPEEFRSQYAEIADTIGIKSLHNWGSADANQRLVQFGHSDRLVCPLPFYELVVKANGIVTVCCVDWNNKLAVGDANINSLIDIWNGERLRALQAVHLSGRRNTLDSCASCTAFHGHPDNLDMLVTRVPMNGPQDLDRTAVFSL